MKEIQRKHDFLQDFNRISEKTSNWRASEYSVKTCVSVSTSIKYTDHSIII